MPFFLVELLLHTAVEEERYVRVLLGLCVRWVRVVDAEMKGIAPPAMCACLTSCFASHSASTFVIACGGKATLKGNSALYRDMVVMC